MYWEIFIKGEDGMLSEVNINTTDGKRITFNDKEEAEEWALSMRHALGGEFEVRLNKGKGKRDV
jgi:hypothetical protein